jgi:hypothetical protein
VREARDHVKLLEREAAEEYVCPRALACPSLPCYCYAGSAMVK